MDYPARKAAEVLLKEAETLNPGSWGNHSRVAARCAETIARRCCLNPEKAYVMGLLHDIGRRFGRGHLRHVWDGYRYMMELGYPAVAQICLTHSFNLPELELYIGQQDLEAGELEMLIDALGSAEYDDYDQLIQLCDCLAGSEGVVNMEARMDDVARRYGFYPEEKRQSNYELWNYFTAQCGADLHELLREDER